MDKSKIINYIQNKTEFVISPLDNNIFIKEELETHHYDYDKYITKVFVNCDKPDTVLIDQIVENPLNISNYGMLDDFIKLSNGIILSPSESELFDKLVGLYVNELVEETDQYYFIMEKNQFEFKYEDFKSKLSKLLARGHKFEEIKFFYNEFTKDSIDIL